MPSPRVTKLLSDAGHDALHVIDAGLAGRPDTDVLALATSGGRVLLSADTDFGELMASSKATTPSVILIRRSNRRPEAVASVLLANIDQIAEELRGGAFVVLAE